jgi:hypothetical protein
LLLNTGPVVTLAADRTDHGTGVLEITGEQKAMLDKVTNSPHIDVDRPVAGAN